MKKIVQIIIAIVITLAAMICIYEILENKKEEEKNLQSQKFKQEYESLNGKTNSNGKEYVEVSIADNNNVIYLTEEETIEMIKSGTGIIYFGFKECPWCRNMIPILIESAKETSIENIYYLDIKEIRDTKILDANGKIVTEKEGTKEYYSIVKLLDKYLGDYSGLNDSKIKRLYAPTVAFIRNGVVVGIHIGTLDSQEDPYVVLNNEQKEELKEIYLKYIHKVLGDLCDESC